MHLRIFKYLQAVTFLGTLCSCALFSPQEPTLVGSSNIQSKQLLGELNGQPIYESGISKQVRAKIQDLESELAQRSMHLKWLGFEEAIDIQLLTTAAQAEGITPRELLEKNTQNLITPPTQEELRLLYETHKQSLGVSYEKAEPLLKQKVIAQERKALESSFFASLRANAQINYKIEVPNFPRTTLDEGSYPTYGNPESKITLVEFSDFQCPYCARGKQLIQQLQELYPKDLKIVFRDFPHEQHSRAMPAAVAAHCAHQQGKFWEYHNLLFANSDALEDSDLNRYAKQIGLKSPLFDKCRASPEATDFINKNREKGLSYGVKGTPAIYINGIKLVGLLPLPLIRAIIDKEMGK